MKLRIAKKIRAKGWRSYGEKKYNAKQLHKAHILIRNLGRDDQERQIVPAVCYTWNSPHSDGTKAVKIRSEYYLKILQHNKVGDLLRFEYSAPGYGYKVCRITRICDAGVYGVVVESRLRVLSPSDVY